MFCFEKYINDLRRWQENTFGPGKRNKSVIDHLRKEIKEVEENPNDLNEWIDIIILSLEGAWRNGFGARDIISCLLKKLKINKLRKWPDWRKTDKNKAIEHIKE